METKEMHRSKIKIMTDYSCYPLWITDENGFDNLNPADLPISEQLKKLLDDWEEKYDGILNRDIPQESGFKTLAGEIEFEHQGALIFKMMLDEIGDKYTIEHFFRGNIYHSVDELNITLLSLS